MQTSNNTETQKLSAILAWFLLRSEASGKGRGKRGWIWHALPSWVRVHTPDPKLARGGADLRGGIQATMEDFVLYFLIQGATHLTRRVSSEGCVISITFFNRLSFS